MSQENPLSVYSYESFLPLFEALKPVCKEDFPEEEFLEASLLVDLCDSLKTRFVEDYLWLDDAADLLFEEGIADFGARTTVLFAEWEERGSGPMLPALVAQAVRAFALDVNSPVVKGAFLSAIMAEAPNGCRYHGNEHYRKVLFHAIRLVSTHNQLAANTDMFLTPEDIAVLLVGSCVHDLGHKGGDNVRDGVYTPGYLEQRSFDIAKPYLKAVGVDDEVAGAVETIVFCTDITFFAGDNSPCVRMKKIYQHYFWEEETEDVSLMMMGKLRRYDENPKLVLMAMLVHEADIASSAGMSYEWTIRETIKFMEERGMRSAGPKVVLAFLREQLGETLFTTAGKTLYGAVMAQVIEQAERDVKAGRETYYE